VLNTATWRPLIECVHGATIAAPSSAVIYREVEEGSRPPLAAMQARGHPPQTPDPPPRLLPPPPAARWRPGGGDRKLAGCAAVA